MNLSLPLRGLFLALDLAWTDILDPISCTCTIGKILNVNGFSIDSKPVVSFLLSSLLGSITCMRWTFVLYMSNSNCMTSEIASNIRILMMWFSDPNYVKLAFK